MRTNKITISENGKVYIPIEVIMYPVEIADLFGVYTQTIVTNIKTLLKSGIIDPNISGEVTSLGNTVTPIHFGLDMVIALAFRIHSPKAQMFRQWVFKRMKEDISPTKYIIGFPTGINLN